VELEISGRKRESVYVSERERERDRERERWEKEI